MPELLPFQGLRYDASRVNLESVVAPPYDVIAPDLQARLYERDPYNVVRLILSRDADPYASAAGSLAQWQKDGILVRDASPAVYVLHQTFDGPQGVEVTRKGFVILCRLEEFESRVILPHEKTHSGPKEDRLNLLKATQTNLSQILCLYSDPAKEVDRILNGHSRRTPDADVVYEEVRNRVWVVTDQQVAHHIAESLRNKQILIADGHHRYETALAYRAARKAANPGHTGRESYNFIMMFLTNVEDEGLVIYPTHRVIHSLPSFDASDFLKRAEDYFIVRSFEEEGLLLSALTSSSGPSFAVHLPGERSCVLLSLKPVLLPDRLITEDLPAEVKQLDVTILHSVIFRDILGMSLKAQEEKRNLEFVRDAGDAVRMVRSGSAQLAFLMNAPNIAQVRAVARAGHTMPQKSTYFYPKLLSGLVMNPLAE